MSNIPRPFGLRRLDHVVTRLLAAAGVLAYTPALFVFLDEQRGISLTSVDQRAEQAILVCWTLVATLLVVSLIERRVSPLFWRGLAGGLAVACVAIAGSFVRPVNPAETLLTILVVAGVSAAAFHKGADDRR